MRRIAILCTTFVIILASVTAGGTAVAGSASAIPGDAGHSPGVMTLAEFRNVKRGDQTLRQVRAIADAKGTVYSRGYGFMTVNFRAVSPAYAANVYFRYRSGRWRTIYKFWMGRHYNNRCVTEREWRQVRIGMTKARVHRIFGIHGWFAEGHGGGYTRRYRPCNWNGGTDVALLVTYNGWTHRVAERRLR